ncbi:unnamed protein product, partial [marine sediment metagenome]
KQKANLVNHFFYQICSHSTNNLEGNPKIMS